MRTPEFMHEDGKFTQCLLCPNQCRIAEGHRGRCLARGRENGSGVLFNYAQVTSAHVDPIEKKPLYHFYPGSPIFSIGSYGCNLSCRFCQNYEISQQICASETVQPQRLALWAASVPNNVGVAFTYNEPGIWYEYIIDSAPLLKKQNLAVVMVTNGYLSPEPWAALCSVTDAMNIDLKGFTPEFYSNIAGGALEPVLANITTAVKSGVHVELTNLVVPGLNDDKAVFERMIEWVAALSPDIPFHISRYFPRFREHAPPTPPETLEDFAQIANKRLNYVYIGNIPDERWQNTLCPSCGKTLIRRSGYEVEIVNKSSVCSCGEKIPIKSFE